MKFLNNCEINQVSGGDLNLGDGLWIRVNPAGIPDHAYSFIDSVTQQTYDGKISIETGSIMITNAGYTYYHGIYSDHLAKGDYEIYFA